MKVDATRLANGPIIADRHEPTDRNVASAQARQFQATSQQAAQQLDEPRSFAGLSLPLMLAEEVKRLTARPDRRPGSAPPAPSSLK
jgi:hypothetical protein